MHNLLGYKQSKPKFILFLFIRFDLLINHLKYWLLVLLWYALTGVLNDENYLLLFDIVIYINEHVTFLGVLNCIEDQVEGHLLHSLLVADDFLRQKLVPFHFGNVIKNWVVFYLLVNTVKQFLYLLNLNQLYKNFVFIWNIWEVWVENESGLLFGWLKVEFYNILDFLECIVQLKWYLIARKLALFKSLPVFDVVDGVKHHLTQDSKLAKLFREINGVIWVVLVKFLELSIIAHLFNSTVNLLKLGTDLLVQIVGNYILEVILGHNLLVQDSKCDIFKIGNGNMLLIEFNLLVDNIYQELLLGRLTFLCWWFAIRLLFLNLCLLLLFLIVHRYLIKFLLLLVFHWLKLFLLLPQKWLEVTKYVLI